VNVALPSGLTERLNALGFAATDSESPFTFARTGIGSEVWVTVESIGHDTWRVGVKWLSTETIGELPNPVLRMELPRLGPSADGATLDLSTSELISRFPDLLRRPILPMVDLPESQRW